MTIFKFASPSGYTPQVSVHRADTLALLGIGVAAESAVLGYYTVSIDVGSYVGNVIASLQNPDGTLYGNTLDGVLSDVPSSITIGTGTGNTAPNTLLLDSGGVPGVEVFTLHDLSYRLGLRAGGRGSERDKELYARAIQDTMRALPSRHEWNYFKRQARFTTSPSVGMEVEYQHTGGAYERLLTITNAAAFPEDAQFGQIRVDNHTYRIANRISDTMATLQVDFAMPPGFSGTVLWERPAYTFSRQIAKMHYLRNITANRPVMHLALSEFSQGDYTRWGRGVADRFTWQNRGNIFGAAEIILQPAPALAEVYEVSASVLAIIPKITAVTGSGLACASGSTEVAVEGANFSNKLIGSIIRISGDAQAPINDRSEDFEFQAFVIGVSGPTSLTISTPAPDALSGRGYLISSPIEIEAQVMLEFIEDEAYHQYCKNHDHKSLPTARAIAQESLLAAMRRDKKISESSNLRSTLWDSYQYGFYPITIQD
jgi:hypothetical protein